MTTYTSNIKPTYIALRSIYLAGASTDSRMTPGRVRVLIKGDETFSAEGTFNNQGGLTGMAKLYKKLALKENDTISFSVIGDNEILITDPVLVTASTPSAGPALTTVTAEQSVAEYVPVFSAKNFHHIHLEAFRPENLNNWEPEAEVDVYLAFGVLQTFTDFQYCCGVSQALLNQLGANYGDRAKPDAILIDRTNDRYLMAEWKKKSSDFDTNHSPDDVDILVCWDDDELDRKKLPYYVVALRSIAQKAANEALFGV